MLKAPYYPYIGKHYIILDLERRKGREEGRESRYFPLDAKHVWSQLLKTGILGAWGGGLFVEVQGVSTVSAVRWMSWMTQFEEAHLVQCEEGCNLPVLAGGQHRWHTWGRVSGSDHASSSRCTKSWNPGWIFSDGSRREAGDPILLSRMQKERVQKYCCPWQCSFYAVSTE